MSITDERIERIMYQAGAAGDALTAGLARTALGYRPDATPDEIASCREVCEALADSSEIEQLRADNAYLRAALAKVRRDRDEAIALIDGLESDLARVRAENTELLVRLGSEQLGRERGGAA